MRTTTSRSEGRQNRCPPSVPPSPLAVDAAHAEVFDLEEFLDAVFRAFAADAAFLHAAERRDLGRDDALVDADDAVFEPLGDAPDVADVAARPNSVSLAILTASASLLKRW